MKKVLIAEDQHTTLDLIEGLVHHVDADARVFLADCVEKAYLFAMKYTIDLFIVDLMLKPGKKSGDMSGAEFVQRVRGVDKYYFTPVIIVTSLYDTKQLLYSETHCFQFVEKPFEPEKMEMFIAKAMKFQTKSEAETNWYYRMDGMVGAIPVDEIIYAVSQKDEMEVTTKREKIRVAYKTCREMLNELDSSEFEMCKRGVLVHRKYIKNVDLVNRYIYLEGCDDVLEIGAYMKKRFVKWFYEEQ